jgi:uncharacterized Fe-S cluster-containing MiaB family protein
VFQSLRDATSHCVDDSQGCRWKCELRDCNCLGLRHWVTCFLRRIAKYSNIRREKKKKKDHLYIQWRIILYFSGSFLYDSDTANERLVSYLRKHFMFSLQKK